MLIEKQIKTTREPNLHLIFSSIGAFGWKTPSDRTNSPNSITPLRLISNKSKIYFKKSQELMWIRPLESDIKIATLHIKYYYVRYHKYQCLVDISL